ncbi:hypothetical protein RchiOBHm_Chr1g0326731 [Rosa chinensis]|uniref:Uncharacterized protein n=1 Tax=Rosa chinensis TaxID=74649 RepID=A0A2P6SAA7_ROSCH|nr:hypothetical protein RchiOBHm_Chr1g0326731 [Rosa chinensis]
MKDSPSVFKTILLKQKVHVTNSCIHIFNMLCNCLVGHHIPPANLPPTTMTE